MTENERDKEIKKLNERLDVIEEWIKDNFHKEDCYDIS